MRYELSPILKELLIGVGAMFIGAGIISIPAVHRFIVSTNTKMEAAVTVNKITPEIIQQQAQCTDEQLDKLAQALPTVVLISSDPNQTYALNVGHQKMLITEARKICGIKN